MHELALVRDLVTRVEQVAAAQDAARVTRITVRLGVLSHCTPEHFREHFEDAARGTVAAHASVDARVAGDATGADAAAIVLESVEVELPDPEPSGAGGSR
jgi:hydrogenase nickel incorporation protein HypA/HybF